MSSAAYRTATDLSARGANDLSGTWEHDAPAWDRFDGDSRDLLFVLSTLLGVDMPGETRLGS